MKMDKTGACTVIAAIATVARLAPGTPLLAVAPAVENMPGPHSTRPGDIVKALNGKKVDITNTDAEGRLILGDAMTYAEQLGATHLVDVATLTGAVARARSAHLDHRRVRAAAGLVRRGRRRRRPRRRALLAAAAHRRLRPGHGELVRRPPELGSAEGSLVKSALFLREFVTRAVGPPRHRRHRLLPQGAAVRRRAARPASSHATLVELALAGAERGLSAAAGTPIVPARSAAEPLSLAARGGRRRSGSSPTASRRAGRSTTRSIRRAGRSTGGRSSACVVGAVALGAAAVRFAGDPLALVASGRGS